MDGESDDLRALIDTLKRGDPSALGPAFAAYRDRLRRMIDFRIDTRLRGRVSTSDVLQDAYIDALKRLHHYRDARDIPFYVWLRSVTLQRVVDIHRHHLGAAARDADREISIDRGGGGVEASSEKMAELMGDLTSPSGAARRGEAIAGVRAALDRLEPADREVLALRHFEELSNVEVAALLGIRPPAASKRYLRAIERLKDALGEIPGIDEEG